MRGVLDVPCGYVKLPTGEVARDPDEQVQSIVQLVFYKFDELGSCKGLYRHLVRNKILLGMRLHDHDAVGWMAPAQSGHAVPDMHHPIYAGAYSYGRRRVDHNRSAASGGKVKMREVPMSEWMVLQRAACRPISRGNGTRPTNNGCSRTARGPVLRGCPAPARRVLTSLLVCEHVASACRQLSEQVDRLL